MEPTLERWHFKEGDEVRSGDDHKLGKVVALYPAMTRPTHLVVEGGLLFHHAYYVPVDAVTTHDGGRVYVGATKAEAQALGWDVEPGTATLVGTPGAVDAAAGMAEAEATRTDAGMGAAATDVDASRVAEGETLRVPVHEEELTAATREREIGEVHIEKRVVAEERVLEVPITEERVRVERRVVDRPADPGEAAFEEGVIEVPIRGEEVELQKRVRVAEEVEVGKEAVQRTEQVAGTVRREEVRVSEVDAEEDVPGGGRT